MVSSIPPWGLARPELLVCGIDPGQHGGVAIVGARSERIKLAIPMPMRIKKVGKTSRLRPDMDGTEKLVRLLVEWDVALVVMEDTGAGYGASGKQLGIGIGILQTFLYQARLRTEEATPGKWKKAMVAPADKKEAFYRAECLFPEDKDKIRGPNGGKHDGKAEASLIALYGARHLLGSNRK
jgi:Holliday junction resolvasome RuvABC endonuclease subunit